MGTTEGNRRWVEKNRDRVVISTRARRQVAAAIRRGSLSRATACESCGTPDVPIEAAHSDYSEPLNVRWLCRPCHRQWDANEPKTVGVSLSVLPVRQYPVQECIHGHQYTPDNTYVTPTGGRACRRCHQRKTVKNREMMMTMTEKPSEPVDLPRLLTVVQVAEYLHVNVDTVRRWCRNGDLPARLFGDRIGYRIRQEDLEAFARNRGQ